MTWGVPKDVCPCYTPFPFLFSNHFFLFYVLQQSAKAGWQAENDTNSRSVTSYSAMHSAKRLDEPTQLRVRPESPNRMNKPHPEK